MNKLRGIFKKKKKETLAPAPEVPVEAPPSDSMSFNPSAPAPAPAMKAPQDVNGGMNFPPPGNDPRRPPTLPPKPGNAAEEDSDSDSYDSEESESDEEEEEEEVVIPQPVLPQKKQKNKQKQKHGRNKKSKSPEPDQFASGSNKSDSEPRGSNFMGDGQVSPFQNQAAGEQSDMQINLPPLKQPPRNPSGDDNRMAVKPMYNMYGVPLDYSQFQAAETPQLMHNRPPVPAPRRKEKVTTNDLLAPTADATQNFQSNMDQVLSPSPERRKVRKKVKKKKRRKEHGARNGNVGGQNGNYSLDEPEITW